MQCIIQNKNIKYEMANEEFSEIQDTLYNINSFIQLMQGYCEHSLDNVVETDFFPLLKILELTHLECEKLINKFEN